jgi:monoamine oxidase
MGFGLLNQIYLQFNQIFWQTNLRRITVVHPQFKFYFCLSEHRILALYVSGYVAKQLEEKTDQQIIEDIFNSLHRIYPQITYPIKWLITRWGEDPFSKGSYSTFHCGNNLQTLKQLAEETHHGRVHWAGEHTNFDGSIGYVDSGFQSGIRQAKKILNKLQS